MSNPGKSIDWSDKLRRFLQTEAFCLVIAALHWTLVPDRPSEISLVYSMSIGFFSWAIIDFGRHLFPSSRQTGWPTGVAWWLLVGSGIVGGYLLGTATGDAVFGWSSWRQGHPSMRVGTSILITVLAGAGAAYYFFSQSRGHYLERKMAEERGLATEARLRLLEAQLEPHMLFNTLANLRALIGTDPPRAQQMLDHMIAYLRATLDASRAGTHTLAVEFARLRDYLELMAVRMGPRLAYTLDLPDTLAQQAIPALLLQPLVENAIKHGLEPKVEGGSIVVCARREGERLVLEVRDTGVGCDAAEANGGFGLVQVRERLHALFGDAAGVDFTASRGQGAQVRLVVPT